MSRPWLDRLPHAAWVIRMSTGRSAFLMLPVFVAMGLGLAAADALGYMSGVSYALSLFLVVLAFPVAAATLHQFDTKGTLDVLRLSGARDGAWLGGLIAGLIIPVLGAAIIILSAGLATQVVTPRQLLPLLVALGTTACLAIAASQLSVSRRNWAAHTLLAIGLMVGGIAAAVSNEPGRFAAYEWITRLTVWPIVLVAEATVVAAMVPGFRRALARPHSAGLAYPRRRRLPWRMLLDRSPVFARAMLHSFNIAFNTMLFVLGAIGVTWLLPWGDARLKLMAASAMAFIPVPIAIAVSANESRMEAESGRLHLLRGTPHSPAWSAILSIAGWTLPFAVAGAVAALAVKLTQGSWPALRLIEWPVQPLIASLVLAIVPAGVAAEGWMSRSHTHMLGAASVLPIIAVAYAAQRSTTELVLAVAATAWIPWMVAAAVYGQPDRPRFNPWVSIAGMAAASFASLNHFFMSPNSEFRVDPALLAAGLVMAAPMFGGERRALILAAATVVGVSLSMVFMKGFPPGIGLAAIALLPLALWSGDRAGRWRGERPSQVRVAFVYTLFFGGILLHAFLPGRDLMTRAELATRVYLMTAVMLVLAVAISETARMLVVDRAPRRGWKPGASS